MCGRFVSSSPLARLGAHFGAAVDVEPLPERFNVAPTDDIYGVVADSSGRRAVRSFRWGLVPSWATDTSVGSRLINARSETVAHKPAFRSAFARRRCIIAMDGFYEWAPGVDGGPVTTRGKLAKRPHFIHRVDGEPLAVAGIWEQWHDPDAPHDAAWLHTTAVLTTSANSTLAPIHDRMPVILPVAMWSVWLDPDNHDTTMLSALLVPADHRVLAAHEVATDVNNVRNDGIELIAAV